MKKARKMPEIVLRLKALKADLGLSNTEIANMLQQKGYSTSLSTVKRVFAEGSEHQSFWYEESIQPIEEILLTEAPPLPVENLESLEDAQQYVSQIEGLQAVASFKDELMGAAYFTITGINTDTIKYAVSVYYLWRGLCIVFKPI